MGFVSGGAVCVSWCGACVGLRWGPLVAAMTLTVRALWPLCGLNRGATDVDGQG